MIKKILFWTILILLFLAGFCFGFYIKKTYFGELKNSDGRTNFLILGIRGYDFADSDLTDTIIFVSLDRNSQKAALLSIPRDLWVTSIQAKINTAYHYGGFELPKKTVAEVLGQNIDYMVVINFDSFGEVIDSLGGVLVDVQNSFDDLKYPIAGKEEDLCNGDKELKCRYEAIYFEAGLQLMDGATALKYIRSRNAVGEEGTDFARSARQQQLILALKQKILTPEVYLHPKKLLELFSVFQRGLTIDINKKDYGKLAQLVSKINWGQIKTTALNGNLLINPKNHYSKQWVLVPKSGDWQEVQQFVEGILK